VTFFFAQICEPIDAALASVGDEQKKEELVNGLLTKLLKRYDGLPELRRTTVASAVGLNIWEIAKACQKRSSEARRLQQTLIASAVPTCSRSASSSMVSVGDWLSVLGVSKSTFYGAQKRRALFLSGESDQLFKARKRRKDCYDVAFPEIAQGVLKFFSTPSELVQPSPDYSQVLHQHFNKHGKRVRNHRKKKPEVCAKNGCKMETRVDVMGTRLALYEDFMSKISDFLPPETIEAINDESKKIKLSYNIFQRHIPWHVKRKNSRSMLSKS
jgi:hypothetical protein